MLDKGPWVLAFDMYEALPRLFRGLQVLLCPSPRSTSTGQYSIRHIIHVVCTLKSILHQLRNIYPLIFVCFYTVMYHYSWLFCRRILNSLELRRFMWYLIVHTWLRNMLGKYIHLRNIVPCRFCTCTLSQDTSIRKINYTPHYSRICSLSHCSQVQRTGCSHHLSCTSWCWMQ